MSATNVGPTKTRLRAENLRSMLSSGPPVRLRLEPKHDRDEASAIRVLGDDREHGGEGLLEAHEFHPDLQ